MDFTFLMFPVFHAHTHRHKVPVCVVTLHLLHHLWPWLYIRLKPQQRSPLHKYNEILWHDTRDRKCSNFYLCHKFNWQVTDLGCKKVSGHEFFQRKLNNMTFQQLQIICQLARTRGKVLLATTSKLAVLHQRFDWHLHETGSPLSADSSPPPIWTHQLSINTLGHILQLSTAPLVWTICYSTEKVIISTGYRFYTWKQHSGEGCLLTIIDISGENHGKQPLTHWWLFTMAATYTSNCQPEQTCKVKIHTRQTASQDNFIIFEVFFVSIKKKKTETEIQKNDLKTDSKRF